MIYFVYNWLSCMMKKQTYKRARDDEEDDIELRASKQRAD